MRRVTAKIEDPANVQVTASVTMTVAEWDKFREDLRQAGLTKWPYFRILSAIGDVTEKAKNSYYSESED